MGKEYVFGNEADDNKISEKLPTVNEELDNALNFFLKYKDILKLERLYFIHYEKNIKYSIYLIEQ